MKATYTNLFPSLALPYYVIVDYGITYTLGIGEVRKPRLPGGGDVYLFSEFTIKSFLVSPLTMRI